MIINIFRFSSLVEFSSEPKIASIIQKLSYIFMREGNSLISLPLVIREFATAILKMRSWEINACSQYICRFSSSVMTRKHHHGNDVLRHSQVKWHGSSHSPRRHNLRTLVMTTSLKPSMITMCLVKLMSKSNFNRLVVCYWTLSCGQIFCVTLSFVSCIVVRPPGWVVKVLLDV